MLIVLIFLYLVDEQQRVSTRTSKISQILVTRVFPPP